MSAPASVASSSSSVEVLDAIVENRDTATSPYFADVAGTATFSWPAAERATSTLVDQRTLQRLCEKHSVPKEYRPYVADDKVACASPLPEGSGPICVYADALDAGMRLPLHDFYGALLRHYDLAPSQLAPNAWRYMAAFVLLCQDAGVDPMPSVFQHFFSICAHKGGALGWHHFKANTVSSGGRRRLFAGKVSKTMCPGWKTKFFFLQAPQNAPWPCPVKWGKPSRGAVSKQPVVTTATVDAIEKLLARSSGMDVGTYLSRRTEQERAEMFRSRQQLGRLNWIACDCHGWENSLARLGFDDVQVQNCFGVRVRVV